MEPVDQICHLLSTSQSQLTQSHSGNLGSPGQKKDGGSQPSHVQVQPMSESIKDYNILCGHPLPGYVNGHKHKTVICSS